MVLAGLEHQWQAKGDDDMKTGSKRAGRAGGGGSVGDKSR